MSAVTVAMDIDPVSNSKKGALFGTLLNYENEFGFQPAFLPALCVFIP